LNHRAKCSSRYELRENLVTVTDSAIEQELKTHATTVSLKQTAIRELENRIIEYEIEHKEVQKAAAQFALFLKQYSLSPINDATIAYIDSLITGEQDKIAAGGSRQKLQALEADRREYLETIAILTTNLSSNGNFRPLDEAGVGRKVQELYSLKHFGRNLQRVKNVVSQAHQATYREKPYRIQRTRTSNIKSMFHGVLGRQQPVSTPNNGVLGRQEPALTLNQTTKRSNGLVGWLGFR
jgi:hypothetical protein